jgi:hypothetical protein
MDGMEVATAMAEEPQSVGGVFSASLPTVLAGMVAIGGLLISMQIQSARIEATVVQMAKSIEELKIDARNELSDLDKRVRALELQQ